MRYFPLRSWKDSKVNFSYLAKTNKGKAHTGLDLDCTDIWEDCNGLPDVLSVDDVLSLKRDMMLTVGVTLS